MEIGGIDAEQIVTQLMQLERRPLTVLQTRKDAAKTAAEAIGRIRNNVDSFRLAANKLAERSSFDRFRATVSHNDIVAATVSGSANLGSLTFTVDRLAQSHGLRSVGTVVADTISVTSASVIAVATGTRSIGIETVRAGAGLGVGSSTVTVTQASAGATTTGTALAGSTTIAAGVNDSFDLVVNGAARTVTLAAGTYDRTQLAAAVQVSLDAGGGGVTASLDNAGALQLATTREGSVATLQITAGSALAGLGLPVDPTARVGTDGVIDVNGTLTTVTNIAAGQAAAVDTGAGTLDVTLSGGLRVGTATVKTVSTGSRSLADVAQAINGANAGVSAAAVKVADGAWRLQLSSRSSGEGGRIAIDSSVLDGVAGLVESSAAQNARITIGSGTGAYQVEAAGNTFSNVLSGVTLTAKSVSTTAVSVDVGRNDDAVATDLSNLVNAANAVLADIKVQTRFDATTRTSGALANNGTIRRLAEQIRSAMGGEVVGITGGLASNVGIQVGKDGSFSFDRTKFMTAIAADPTAVARLFGRGGSTTGDAVFANASPETIHGSYAVEVTTAATQATVGALFPGGVGSSARIGVRIGATTATVDITAGQSANQIIAALNDSFAQAGLDVSAEADGAGLRIRANQWGAAGNFGVNLDVLGAGTWDAQTGIDVQGTIDGTTAIGAGRRLLLTALTDSPAAGLAVDITGGVTGSIGSVDYRPGIAARIVEVTTLLTSDDHGVLSTAKDSENNRIKAFTDQMTRLEDRLTVRETNLRRQWANLQSLLGSLQNQGTWLSGQLASLSNNR
jgi:flagellar hook-associated protein 2